MNQGANALSARHLLISQLSFNMLGFEHLKALYKEDPDFGKLYEACQSHLKGHFMIEGVHLFKGTQLCVPKCGTHELLLREVHGGSLADHFGEDKTYTMAKEHFHWPQMLKDIQHH